MELLTVTGRADGPRTVITLTGELQFSTVELAEQSILQVREEHGEHLVFDLERLRFLDSMGLRTVLRFYLAAEGRGGSAALAGPLVPRVARVLQVTGLLQRLTLHPTLADALAVPLPDGTAIHESSSDPIT
ncbi:STAS domain-containing protein [Actinomadura sp. HBU206391]|uniref:STAS domain-containing protein n=1 Tax=Actinomadura sp. HBU206391 TaxID=2731692 RepID=UPI00165065CA|nr:STAS domain-containing protein [Actinomadura sp. HBU206391]MBC6458987.1 STAS domain-containing protein [Actinomadura sp. HBU206391]